MENSNLSPLNNPTPSSPEQTPNNHETKQRRQRILTIVSVVVLVLLLGAIIRVMRHRQGLGSIFQRNVAVNGTVENSTNTQSNQTNTTNSSNATNNSIPSNTTQGNNGSGNSNGSGNTPDLNKYPVGRSTISFDFGGKTRTAILYVPKSYSATNPFPLVVNLHGSESTAEGQENNSHMDQTAEANNFLVVYPNGINEQWNDGRSFTQSKTGGADDVAYIKKLIEVIASGMNVNTKKVYAAGMSNGGMMAQRLACQATGTFAAVADVAGAMPTELKGACSPSGKMPIIIIHGTSDPIVPFNGGDLNSGRGSVLSTLDAVHYWAGVNGASSSPTATVSVANTANDGTTITHYYFGPNVEFFQVNDGGHTWPGGLQYLRPIVIGLVSRDMDASQQIWNFFRNFSR